MSAVNGSGDAVAGLSKHRIEALADGIFAVAMTLLVLDIKMPESITYASNADLWQRLIGLEHAIASYAISFIMLSVYWIAHHFHFHFVQRTDRGLLWINLYLLLCITLVPFTTDLVGDNVHLSLPAILYGVNLLLVAMAFIAQIEYLRRHPELATPEISSGPATALLHRRAWLMTIVPLVSMAIAFYSPRFALYLYLSLPLLHAVPSRLDRIARRSAHREMQ
ncbi:MAG TPA: TMEM175 family protein [Casimicrobiaceae bacterium]|nr:TMEM175 family protein [Casimicrobiaceae bacterium]